MLETAELLAAEDLAQSAEVMAGLFASVFERPTVAVDDDFFELGGDSLVGAALMAAIEKRFGHVLSMSKLLEAPTPRELAREILAFGVSRAAPCVIAVNPAGVRPVVLVVHGNTGESVAPSRLAAALPNRALYAIRAIGLQKGEKLLRTAKAFASTYLWSIEKVRPREQLILMGHCGGTIIVYEMAQQLAAMGRPPVGIILADPEVSEDFAPYLHNSGLSLNFIQSGWRTRAAQLDDAIRRNPNPTGEVRRKIVSGGIKHAIGTYAPRPYNGPALLMCSAERSGLLLNARRGYPTLLSDLDVFVATVGHREMFRIGMDESVAAMERFIGRLDLSQ